MLKFQFNKLVRDKIVDQQIASGAKPHYRALTGSDLDIVEDSPKDDFWGWGPNRDGRNELGKIWMRLRSELRQKRS